jgi:hypothetical protein
LTSRFLLLAELRRNKEKGYKGSGSKVVYLWESGRAGERESGRAGEREAGEWENL